MEKETGRLALCKIVSEEPRDIIEELRRMQYNREGYEDFLRTLKHRLRIYTGRDEVSFYDEEQIVDLLRELKIIE